MESLKVFTVALATILLAVSGHMGLTPSEAIIGERTIVTLRIGHDCGDETVGTTNFTIVLPPRLASVSVEQIANWRVMIHRKVADPPIDTGHSIVEEYISAVTYIGFLPDHFYQLFNLRIQMPLTPGVKLWFKGYQDCHNQGTSIAWETIPNATEPDPRYPARSITLLNDTELFDRR